MHTQNGNNKSKLLLPPEKVILNRWGDYTKPTVSIICTTYNHEKYISNALNGFLSQVTEFPFEVLVRDDCSTDSTAQIVKSYVDSYPNIIKAIFEPTNTYSKGVKPIPQLMKVARGEFFALCEGDDYWVDSYKLQKQYNFFKADDSLALCFHPAYEKNISSGEEKIISNYSSSGVRLFSVKETILLRGAGMPTASLFFKRPNVKALIDSYKDAPVGDFFIQCYLAHQGGVMYTSEVMAVHLRETENSWSRKWQDDKKNKTRRKDYYLKMILSVDSFQGYISDLEAVPYYREVIVHYINRHSEYVEGRFKKILIEIKIIAKLKHFNKLSLLVEQAGFRVKRLLSRFSN